jgi:hypothetical protein
MNYDYMLNAVYQVTARKLHEEAHAVDNRKYV